MVMIAAWEIYSGKSLRSALTTNSQSAFSSYLYVYETGILPNPYSAEKSSKRIITLVCWRQNACFIAYKILSLEIANIDSMSSKEEKDPYFWWHCTWLTLICLRLQYKVIFLLFRISSSLLQNPIIDIFYGHRLNSRTREATSRVTKPGPTQKVSLSTDI